jgi:transcriptional antiterminator NusG
LLDSGSSLCVGIDNARGVPVEPVESWYALRCAPNRERTVRDALGLRGVVTFLPSYWTVSQWSDRKKQVERLLFPGYIFVRVSLGELAGVLQVAGVLGALPSSLRPAAVSETDISSVERCITSLLSVESVPVPASYARGERVTVASGPLKGASGVVVREGAKLRLICALELMGRAVAVEISSADLARAACHS